MVPTFNFCLTLTIIYVLIWFMWLHIPQLGTNFIRVWLNISVLLLSLVFTRPMNWKKSSTICPCVESLFDFLSSFCFPWIPTINLQTRHRNNLSVCPLVPQSCLITLAFCPPRLMEPLILKILSLSSIPLLLSLIGKTTHQETGVRNSFLPASVATLCASTVPWLEPNRLTFIAFFRLIALSMLLNKMYSKLELKLSLNNRDKPSPPFFESCAT